MESIAPLDRLALFVGRSRPAVESCFGGKVDLSRGMRGLASYTIERLRLLLER